MNAFSIAKFEAEFDRFRRVIRANDKGNSFTSFNEGVAGAWENYKPRLRDHALEMLAADTWSNKTIGSGTILRHAINAIEIQNSRLNLINNLVFWQNRYGHANRDHRLLLEAVSDPRLRQDLETLLFNLYRGNANEGPIFDRLSEFTGGKYPLIAYFYFLKDIGRFMPIQPTTFDRAFRKLGIDLITLRHCSWENYRAFNASLGEIRDALNSIAKFPKLI